MTIFGSLADKIYHGVMNINQGIARRLKHGAKKYTGILKAVQGGAINRAYQLNCQGVIVGHTHDAEFKMCNFDVYPEMKKISYFNTGCWVQQPCHYVEIKNDKGSLERYP